jgi:hypothetical protein
MDEFIICIFPPKEFHKLLSMVAYYGIKKNDLKNHAG